MFSDHKVVRYAIFFLLALTLIGVTAWLVVSRPWQSGIPTRTAYVSLIDWHQQPSQVRTNYPLSQVVQKGVEGESAGPLRIRIRSTSFGYKWHERSGKFSWHYISEQSDCDLWKFVFIRNSGETVEKTVCFDGTDVQLFRDGPFDLVMRSSELKSPPQTRVASEPVE